METKRIYGYQWYLDGVYVCWSETFFATRETVREDMQGNVMNICQQISDNAPESSDFAWNDNFDPDNPDSLEDKDEYADCMETYQRIQYMVSHPSHWRIYEMAKDMNNPFANNCPYDIEWHIMSYKFCDK